jgi:hypothetical protein
MRRQAATTVAGDGRRAEEILARIGAEAPLRHVPD